MFSVTILCFEEVPAFDHLETRFDLLAFELCLGLRETILEPGAPEPVGPLLSQEGCQPSLVPGWGEGEEPRT